MKRPAFCMFIHEYAEHALLFRVFKTDIPGSDSSFRLSTFSTDFSTINTDFPQSRLKGQVFHI